jgi:hypothetical protein
MRPIRRLQLSVAPLLTVGLLAATTMPVPAEPRRFGLEDLASSDCNPCSKPGATATPTPTPVATPTPSPEPGECLAEQKDVNKWRPIVKGNSTNLQVDLTAVACGNIVNIPGLHNCGASCCELSAEKGNQACADKLYGKPVWASSGTIKLVQVYPDNTYTQKVNPINPGTIGTGTITVCGIRTDSCVSFPARSNPPPACQNVTPPPGIPGQGCVTPTP